MEIFKPIPDTDGYYASNQGRIKSRAGNILSPQPHPLGYRIVKVHTADGRYKSKTVHSLVAAAFLGIRPDGYDVCHLDHDKTNNVVTNLKYDTHGNNLAQDWREGRRTNPVGQNWKLNAQIAAQIRQDYANGGVTYSDLGRKYKVAYTTISCVVRGISWRKA